MAAVAAEVLTPAEQETQTEADLALTRTEPEEPIQTPGAEMEVSVEEVLVNVPVTALQAAVAVIPVAVQVLVVQEVLQDTTARAEAVLPIEE